MRTCALKHPLIRLDIYHFRPMKRGHETRGMAGVGPVGGLRGSGSRAIAPAVPAAIIKPRPAFSPAAWF